MLMKIYGMGKLFGAAAVIVLAFLLAGCAGAKKAVPRAGDDHYGSRAHRYFMDGDMPRAIDSYKRGFVTARRIDNALGAARHLSNIGRVYYELGQVDSASLYFARAYEEFLILGGIDEASRAAAFLALCFARGGDGGQARQWFDIATALVNMDKPKSNAHYYAVMRGLIDFKLSSTVTDENAIDAALAFYQKKKKHSALTTIYLLKADLELSRGNSLDAVRYLNDALSSNGRARENYRRSGILMTLAKINFCAGDERAGKHYYERARDSAPKGAAVLPMDEVAACGADVRR
jgi:tetratricopeptide (TPR) repeat protein